MKVNLIGGYGVFIDDCPPPPFFKSVFNNLAVVWSGYIGLVLFFIVKNLDWVGKVD